jgi:hypothetical protein
VLLFCFLGDPLQLYIPLNAIFALTPCQVGGSSNKEAAWAALAEVGAYEEVKEAVWPLVNTSSDDQRGAAWRLLVTAAAASGQQRHIRGAVKVRGGGGVCSGMGECGGMNLLATSSFVCDKESGGSQGEGRWTLNLSCVISWMGRRGMGSVDSRARCDCLLIAAVMLLRLHACAYGHPFPRGPV